MDAAGVQLQKGTIKRVYLSTQYGLNDTKEDEIDKERKQDYMYELRNDAAVMKGAERDALVKIRKKRKGQI